MSSARRAVADAKSDAAGDASCEDDVVTTTVRRRTCNAKFIIIRARMLGFSIDRTLDDTSRHFGINCPIRMAASSLMTEQSGPRKLTGPHRVDDFDGMTDGQEKAHRRSFFAHRTSIESSMGPRWENVQSGRCVPLIRYPALQLSATRSLLCGAHRT